MKINKSLWIALSAAVLISCENESISFPDFDYQTVYFANQYSARTIELGEDLFVDVSLDNQHKVKIQATTGGVYTNKKNIIIDFRLDNSLCDNLYFASNNAAVVPMPAEYYQLASNQIKIASGSIRGGVEVQLTDAFFEDPKSLTNNYAIPLIMTGVQNADSILQGIRTVDNPDRCVDADWSVKPRDFVLYVIKYVNPWHGNYLRRGIDKITDVDGTHTTVRHAQYVESDEVVSISTNSLKQSTLPLYIRDSGGNNISYNVTLTFADDETCTVSGSSSAYEITGTGKFVSKGEKQSMGGIDRSALYLDYSVDFKMLNLKYMTKDTLVVRDRGIVPEYFTVVRK